MTDIQVEVLTPPEEDETGVNTPVRCAQCEAVAEVLVSRRAPMEVLCSCGGLMSWYPAGMTFGISARGPGTSETKIGQRRKRELTKRNERLSKTQWDQHEPVVSKESLGGKTPKNFTKGGPLDPNSRFNK